MSPAMKDRVLCVAGIISVLGAMVLTVAGLAYIAERMAG